MIFYEFKRPFLAESSSSLYLFLDFVVNYRCRPTPDVRHVYLPGKKRNVITRTHFFVSENGLIYLCFNLRPYASPV